MRRICLFASVAILLLAVAAVALEAPSSGRVFVVTMLYDNGAISDGGAYVAEGIYYPERDQPSDGYLARLLDKNSDPLLEVRFNFPLVLAGLADPSWFDESGRQVVIPNGTSVTLQKSSKDVLFPYSEEAGSVEVYSPGGIRLLKIPLSHLTSFCGDSVCAPGEQCDVDCPKESPKLIPLAVKQSSFPVLPVVVAVAVVSLAAVFIFIRRRPQKAAVKAPAPARQQQAQASAPAAAKSQPQQLKPSQPSAQQQPIKRQMSPEELKEYYALQQLQQKYGYNRK
ncbi:hypothetical protein HYY74_06685 [Candidatus Woesearchaeota archaeon]|nr:hypothetical protein [Candidatus Woesearchaeota archaeon]